MKKTARILSIAALVAMGIMGAACSKIESLEIETPETQKENIVTLTTTVGFAADDTKALTGTGVKTFGAGDQMAVIYKQEGGTTAKAVGTLTSGAGTKSGTFTFTLTNPDKTQNVTYIYPAAMAGSTGVDYTKLNSQSSGTLTDLGRKYDLATNSGAWNGDNLPTLTLENQLAILAVTLKNEAGTSDITSSTTKLTVSDGTNTYNVNRSAAAGPIYVAIRPTTSANISIEATSGSQGYYKNLTTKTYAANNGYSVSWKMMPATLLSTITSNYTAQDGETLYGKLGSNVKISIADGATVTLNNVTINGTNNSNYAWAGITCAGDATITLEGTNTVKGFYENYPGIHIATGKTLIIKGSGTLTASTNNGDGGAGIGAGRQIHCGNIEIQNGTITANGGQNGAGIGGGFLANCGNITISGGTVMATGGYKAAGIGGGVRSGSTAGGNCGNITISGGTVTATGGENAAGIGGGRGNNNNYKSSCGTITIANTVTKVTATMGSGSTNSIGAGKYCNCGTVTIGGVVGAITDSPYIYEP